MNTQHKRFGVCVLCEQNRILYWRMRMHPLIWAASIFALDVNDLFILRRGGLGWTFSRPSRSPFGPNFMAAEICARKSRVILQIVIWLLRVWRGANEDERWTLFFGHPSRWCDAGARCVCVCVCNSLHDQLHCRQHTGSHLCIARN